MTQESGRGSAAPPSVWRNIPAIRGAAIAGMIVTHSIEFSLGIAGVLDARPADWPPWQSFVELVGRALGPQCVPVFLFASGFFMYRFSKTWSAAWGSARGIAIRYVLWALPGYAFLLLVQKEMGPADAVLSFLQKGPYYGTYWFLVLLFQLCLAAPLLARWVDASLRSAVAFGIALQVVASAHHYWSVGQGVEPAWRFVLWRLPFFLAGMIVSSRSERVAGWLAGRRRQLTVLLVLSQLALVAECVLVRSYAQDKVTLVLASLLVLAWALTLPAEGGRVRSWLGTLGMNSMAVLLASDLFFGAMGRLLWHAGHWLGLPAPPPGEAPAYMRTVVMAVPFLLAGLVGPLLVAHAVERLFGKPARRLVFG
jgi:surface polysaccharide O-acyltransferase-like enzyme